MQARAGLSGGLGLLGGCKSFSHFPWTQTETLVLFKKADCFSDALFTRIFALGG